MYYPRKLLETLEKHISTREIIVLTGMRRVGKTTLFSLLFEKIPSSNKVFIDLENPFDQRIFEEKDYNKILSNLTEHGLNPQNKMYIFLDEVQAKPEIMRCIKYLYDHHMIKFFLISSNSFYTKNLSPGNLAGRKFTFELFPLIFEEFLIFKDQVGKFGTSLDQRNRSKNSLFFERTKKLYAEYLKFGGFPEVVLAKKREEKISRLKDILKSYFEKDVKALAAFSKISLFRDLVLLLAQRSGQRLDITKISSEIGVSRMTVYSYLSFLKETYFIRLVSPFSNDVNREISGTKKVYFCDHGMANHCARVDEEQLFKNCVFNNLRKFGKVNYYQRRSGEEIDFVLNERIGVEVKMRGLESNLRKLNNICKEIGLNESYLISNEYIEKENFIPATNI
tara:strand:+ start:12673 stop:13854 length:1182 start_codon:yes stop_codon:yes gene_type:complete